MIAGMAYRTVKLAGSGELAKMATRAGDRIRRVVPAFQRSREYFSRIVTLDGGRVIREIIIGKVALGATFDAEHCSTSAQLIGTNKKLAGVLRL